MGTSTEIEPDLLCPQCGKHALTNEYIDAHGYETQESTCHACGYYVIVDMGFGSDWSEAEWRSNMINGVLAMGTNEGTCRFVPCSLQGALAAQGEIQNWAVFVTMTEVTTIAGQLPSGQTFDEAVDGARKMLSEIKLIEYQAAA